MDEIMACAKTLAALLQRSEVYRDYCEKKEALFEDEMLGAMYKAYLQAQFRARADMLSGKIDSEAIQKTERLGQFLQLDPVASEFLMAEYRVNDVLTKVYKLLAEAVDIDLSALEV